MKWVPRRHVALPRVALIPLIEVPPCEVTTPPGLELAAKAITPFVFSSCASWNCRKFEGTTQSCRDLSHPPRGYAGPMSEVVRCCLVYFLCVRLTSSVFGVMLRSTKRLCSGPATRLSPRSRWLPRSMYIDLVYGVFPYFPCRS